MKDKQPLLKQDKLSSLIFSHWQQFHPKMLAQFQSENRVEEELEKTARQMFELHYQLVMIDKMDYQAAREIVIDQFLLPEEEESSMNQKQTSSPFVTLE